MVESREVTPGDVIGVYLFGTLTAMLWPATVPLRLLYLWVQRRPPGSRLKRWR